MTTIVTNGCFDILSVGHVRFLEKAKKLAQDGILIVGVNSDASVRELKGSSRPIIPQSQRLEMIKAIKWVDQAYIFDSTDCVDFLEVQRPNVWVKAGYTMATLNQREVRMCQKIGCQIVLFEPLADVSTTKIIERIRRNA